MSEAECGAAPHPSSPFGRLRKAAEDRTRTWHEDFDVPGWDDLVVRVGVIEDTENADRALRLFAGINESSVVLHEDKLDAVAAVVAAATRGLYERQGDGTLEQVRDDAGSPVLLDARFGQQIGKPDCATPVGAVFQMFTTGDDPPRLNAGALLMWGMTVVMSVVNAGDMGDAASGS